MPFISGCDFINFVRSTRQWRFIREPSAADFLECLLATSGKRKLTMPIGTTLWRSQIGSAAKKVDSGGGSNQPVDLDEYPYPVERMTPMRDSAAEGRVNPKGVPCLYLSTEKSTAMGEARPWLGQSISLGRFESVRPLTLIDFSLFHNSPPSLAFLEKDLSPDALEMEIWAQVDKAFSLPVSNDTSSSDYVPTQIIAEAFKAKSYDGVVYKSRLGSGYNVALFDIDAARLRACSLFRAGKIEFRFEEACNHYYVPPVSAGSQLDTN